MADPPTPHPIRLKVTDYLIVINLLFQKMQTWRCSGKTSLLKNNSPLPVPWWVVRSLLQKMLPLLLVSVQCTHMCCAERGGCRKTLSSLTFQFSEAGTGQPGLAWRINVCTSCFIISTDPLFSLHQTESFAVRHDNIHDGIFKLSETLLKIHYTKCHLSIYL